MPNPLEILFSIYFIAYPPFFARLEADELQFSNRVKLIRYRRANGKTVRFDLIKRDRKSSRIHRGDNIRAIAFFTPEPDFNSFVSNERNEHFIYMGGYQWKWIESCQYLVAYDGASGFVLEHHEAKLLASSIFGTP